MLLLIKYNIYAYTEHEAERKNLEQNNSPHIKTCKIMFLTDFGRQNSFREIFTGLEYDKNVLLVLVHTHDSDLSHFCIKARRGIFCLGNILFQLTRNSVLKVHKFLGEVIISLCIVQKGDLIF